MKIEIDINLKIDSSAATLIEKILSVATTGMQKKESEKVEKLGLMIQKVTNAQIDSRNETQTEKSQPVPVGTVNGGTNTSKAEKAPVGSHVKRIKLTPEEKKVKRLAYNRRYYIKNREKMIKQQRERDARNIKIGPAVAGGAIEHPEAKLESKGVPSPNNAQSKLDNASIREDAHIKSMILFCSCPRAEKIVKGLEVNYGGKIYYSNKCLEEFLNKDIAPANPETTNNEPLNA